MSASGSAAARSSFGSVLAGRGGSALLQSVVLVLLARDVAPSTFGVVATFATAVTVVGAVADLGLETTALRSAAAGQSDVAVISRLHRRTVGVGCAVILVVSLALVRLVPDLAQALPLVLWVWLERRLSLHTGLLIAAEGAKRAAAVLVASRATTMAAFLALALVVPPVLAFSCASVLGSLLGCVAASVRVHAAGPPTRGRALLRRARPFWVASMSGLLRTLDVPVVQAVAGATAAGLYALPARAVAPMRLVATSMSTAAIPFAARGERYRLRELERVTLMCAAGMAALLAICWAFVDDLVVSILGMPYLGATDPLRILAIGVIVNVPGAYWSGVLQGVGRERLVARVGTWLVVIFFPFVALGAWTEGAVGAAIGVTTTFVVQMLVFGGVRVRMGRW